MANTNDIWKMRSMYTIFNNKKVLLKMSAKLNIVKHGEAD